MPADHKWYTRLVVAAAIVDALEDLELEFPKVPPERRKALERARHELMSREVLTGRARRPHAAPKEVDLAGSV